jgi:thymidylate kinase
MIIAFMGNDGSGKTTISRQIHKFFADLGFETIYKHEYEYAILRFLFKLIGKKKLEKSRNEMMVQKKRSVSYTLWPILVWFDLLMQYVYYRIFKRRSVILLDRYPYDQYLSFKYLGTITKFTEWLYLHFPKPDMHLVLTVSPEIAYDRKKNTHSYSISFYKKQTEEYLNLARTLGISVINTNDNLQQTVIKVIEKFFQSSRVSNQILHKANQNRVIFHRFREYGLTNKANKDDSIQQALWKEYEYRLESFRRSLHCMRKIIDGTGIRTYVVIKTMDDFHFIGNDIDMLISPSDFEKLLSELIPNSGRYDVSEIKYDQTKDVGKIDVFPKRGMKIDIHSYIGWGNMIFFEFQDLVRFIENSKLFNMDCKVLNSQINSFVIATHAFEKGYLTLDEFLFLKKNFDRQHLCLTMPRISQSLDEFFIKLESILKNQPSAYPIFFPLPIFARCYLKLLRSNGGIRKLHLFVRDLSMVAFWKFRYKVKEMLPFEVRLFGALYNDKIKKDNQA